MRQSSSPSPDWGRPSPPERSRSGSGSNQPKPARWQAKTPPEDCKNTQKTEAWEKWTWEDWQSQSWEQQGWEEQWQEKKCLVGRKRRWVGRKEVAMEGWVWWLGRLVLGRQAPGCMVWGQPAPGKNRRLPKKEGAPGSSRTSGSYVQRQRLAKMMEQNPPKSKEEAEQQRLAAIGRARFQRIHGRQQKHMAAKMEEQQANLEMQQQQLQQLQQQLYWQQSQWQWQQPAVSWVLPQSGYLIHPGLTLYSCFSFRHAVLQPWFP